MCVGALICVSLALADQKQKEDSQASNQTQNESDGSFLGMDSAEGTHRIPNVVAEQKAGLYAGLKKKVGDGFLTMKRKLEQRKRQQQDDSDDDPETDSDLDLDDLVSESNLNSPV